MEWSGVERWYKTKATEGTETHRKLEADVNTDTESEEREEEEEEETFLQSVKTWRRKDHVVVPGPDLCAVHGRTRH